MELKSAIFAMIAFSMIIVAVGVIVGGWNESYNSDLDNDLGVFSKLDSVSAKLNESERKITPASGEASSDFETGMFRGVYGIITTFKDSFSMIFGSAGLIDDLAEEFSIEPWIVKGIIAFISASILFSIIAIIFRLGRTSA